MTAIGEATRIHIREEDARVYYVLARNLYLAAKRECRPKAKHFMEALYRRSAWVTLREIIDAEERRERSAAA